MRANYVERLLARVDGEAAPIWITQVLVLGSPPEIPRLRSALLSFAKETPRLHVAWNDALGVWIPRPRSDEELLQAVHVESTAVPLRSFVHSWLVRPIDLAHELPLRILVAPLTDGRTALVLQLHHALGDARAFMYLNRRLWQWYAGNAGPEDALGPPGMSNERLLRALLRKFPALLGLTDPRNRVLARRGHALRRREGEPGAPMLASFRIPLENPSAGAYASGLFFGSLLAAMIAHDGAVPREHPIRLRVPVDLRRELGIRPALENVASAIPIELDPATLQKALENPAELAGLVPHAIQQALTRGVPYATALECLTAATFAPKAVLRRHVRPDLVAARRANTLVTTYVGSVDRYFTACPLPIEAQMTQTPTWGANGLCFQGNLVVNLTAFEGLWTRDDLDQFADSAATWLTRVTGRPAEVLL